MTTTLPGPSFSRTSWAGAERLSPPGLKSSPAGQVNGIGGLTDVVEVEATLRLDGGDGRSVTEGTYAAFSDRQASDLSILGREILDEFDLIVSRRRDEVLL